MLGVMKTTPRHVNLATALRSGQHHGVFIDDSGSPGTVTPGLHAARKTWAAVVVKPPHVAEVMDQIPNALSCLRDLGITKPEFHFADIWSHKGEYGKLSLGQRIGIFEFMAHIFATYRFEILIQTFDPEQAREIAASADWPPTFGPLRASDHEELALTFLLIRVKKHLQAISDAGATGCVIVDQWKRFGNGRSFTLTGLAPTFFEGSVLFADSRRVPPIQLADFAAFVVNRWQILRVKEELTELDKAFMKAVEPAAACCVNIETVKVHGFPDVKNMRQGMH